MYRKKLVGIKYFTVQQIKHIRKTTKQAVRSGHAASYREWMVIDMLTSSGIRVAECADVRCGDIKYGYGIRELFVRNGKGGQARTIEIPKSLVAHFKQFLDWKSERRECIAPDSPLIIGQRGPITSQGIQLIVKKHLKALGLYENGKSVHALRHSYAVNLYRKEKDLLTVQKQLGHSSIVTTQVYLHADKQHIQNQVNNLWG